MESIPSDNMEMPTGYQDDEGGASTPSRPNTGSRPAKKKSSKAPLIIFGVVLLAIAGVVGWIFFGPTPAVPSKPAQKPTPANVKPAIDPSAANPNAVVSGPEAPPASIPAPVADPNAVIPSAVIDPATGLPMTSQAMATPSSVVQPSPMAAPQQTIDPATGLPTGVAPANPVVQAPMPSNPATELPAQAPADPLASLSQAPSPQPVDQQAQQPVSQQAPVVQAPVAAQDPVAQDPALMSNDPLQQFRDMLAPIDGRVSSLEHKVGRLERSVSRIERDLRSDLSSDRPSSTPNSIKVNPPVSHVVLNPAPAAIQASPKAADPLSDCKIQAIVQGRVWIKRDDDSFASYGEGDTWSNNQVIEQIDPNRGLKINGQWVCM